MPQTVIHLLTSSISPQPGGMQEAAARIAGGLALHEDFQVCVYTRRQDPQHCAPHVALDGVNVTHLSERKAAIMEPLGPGWKDASEKTSNLIGLESARVDYLLVLGALEARMRERPDARHILLSFYVSHNGFVAQQAALSAGIPHIAAVRGSDFHRDIRGPLHYQPLRFVADHAALIVTTNVEQERFLARSLPGPASYRTIYNALPDCATAPYWEARGAGLVRLVADCGFSLKKGTHLLLNAVARLIEEGFAVSLTVYGAVEARERDYWLSLQQRRQAEFPDRMAFPGYVPAEEVGGRLRAGDVYCSASLGEGCSQSMMRAMTSGMPIVATRTGALDELVQDAPHVRTCPPCDEDAFAAMLRAAVRDFEGGALQPDRSRVDCWRKLFSVERERAEWTAAVDSVLS